MCPVNEQPRNPRVIKKPSKRHLRWKCTKNDNLNQCILRLVKGKYLHTREDVRWCWCAWISYADSLIEDVKFVYNNLQLYKEKSKLTVRPFDPFLYQNMHCLTSALGRLGSPTRVACTIRYCAKEVAESYSTHHQTPLGLDQLCAKLSTAWPLNFFLSLFALRMFCVIQGANECFRGGITAPRSPPQQKHKATCKLSSTFWLSSMRGNFSTTRPKKGILHTRLPTAVGKDPR